MELRSKLDQLNSQAKANKWMGYFAVFLRVILAAGFIPSGLTKVFGERFTSLSVNHPMGNYLEALFHTGYYYPFIGYIQVFAAILLLIPRTATLGAVIYFPIILNICILSLAVGFDGSMVTSPLMVLANLYLLCWDYDKLKFILPFKHQLPIIDSSNQLAKSNRFPVKFFFSVIFLMISTVLIITNSYEKKTRNTLQDCQNDCQASDDSAPCYTFCDCIHIEGKSYNACLEEFRSGSE